MYLSRVQVEPQLVRRQWPDAGREGQADAFAWPQWRNVTLAVGLGILFGFSVAAMESRIAKPSPTQDSHSVEISPSNASEELVRLEIRNRRLEVLVGVLRRRNEHRVQQFAPEDTTSPRRSE